MDIVFSVNRLGLTGLGATLTSLIRNCSASEQLKLWFFCESLNEIDKGNISRLLETEGFKGSKEFIDFHARKIFDFLPSLKGDWTTYGRLLISKYIKTGRALFLDADLLVKLDILAIKDFDFKEKLLAAVEAGTVAIVPERSFLIHKLNIPPQAGYFNAGVVYFNLDKWRELDIDRQWRTIAGKFSDELIVMDQTLLNSISRGNFVRLPLNYNKLWPPGSKEPLESGHGILHFVGSPKPWDVMGKILHKGYRDWAAHTPAFWLKAYDRWSGNKLRRTWRIKRSILGHLKNQLLNRNR